MYFRYIRSNIQHTHDTKSKIGIFFSDLRMEIEHIESSEKNPDLPLLSFFSDAI